MAVFTLQNVQDSFERFKKDISDVPTDLMIEWQNFIARFIYRKLLATDPERYIKTTSFTVTTEPQTSALPSDFRDITPVGCGFYEIDDDGDDTDRRLRRTGFGRRDIGYFISGTNVVFTGIEDGTQYRLRYIPELTVFDALADFWTVDNLSTGVQIIPDEYREHLVKAVDALYTQWDEEPGAESFADARFVRTLSEVIENIRKEPDAYQKADFTIMY